MSTTREEPTADDEDACPARQGESHCRCWWDGEPCCRCTAPAMSEAEQRAQGMIEEDPGT